LQPPTQCRPILLPLRERILDEVVQHPIGLVGGAGMEFRKARHVGIFLAEGMQPSAEIEQLPNGLGAVEFGFQRVAIGVVSVTRATDRAAAVIASARAETGQRTAAPSPASVVPVPFFDCPLEQMC